MCGGRSKCQQFARKQSFPKKKWNKAEREKQAKTIYMSDFMKQKYERVIKLATEDWILSTDGVVKLLIVLHEEEESFCGRGAL
jgi:hypothetical protein